MTAFKIPSNEPSKVERVLIREFQRHPEARRLSADWDDTLGWRSAMQHFRCPTRLLDWTCPVEDGLRELHRMNISHRTLFGGLEGYARSVGLRSRRLVELAIDG
jgi:hypothetical protein